jgi:hypothetical protein
MVIRISQIPFLLWGHFGSPHGCNLQEMTSLFNRLLFILPILHSKKLVITNQKG